MDSLIKIIDIELNGLTQRISKIGYQFEIDREAKEFLAKKGYDIEYGARPLKRAIQRYLEDELSEFLLSHDMKIGDAIVATFDKENEKIIIGFKN